MVVRGLSPEEREALAIFAGPPRTFDALDGGEGARLDAMMHTLVARGCVAFRRYDGGASFGLTQLGHVARRLPVAILPAG